MCKVSRQTSRLKYRLTIHPPKAGSSPSLHLFLEILLEGHQREPAAGGFLGTAFRWSFALLSPERPPATFWQPSVLAGTRRGGTIEQIRGSARLGRAAHGLGLCGTRQE